MLCFWSGRSERQESSMCFKAARTGFAVCLLFVSVALAQSEWGVSYSSSHICALRGTTVEMRSTSRYPSAVDETDTVVGQELWFTQRRDSGPADLLLEAEYAGRVKHRSEDNQHTLTVADLRESDSAQYYFHFTTNQPGGGITGSPGVSLSVTGLWVEVRRTHPISHPTWAVLRCRSSCQLPHQRYVWYLNEQQVKGDKEKLADYFNVADSVSCAVRGYEGVPSPSVCVLSPDCNRVTYARRSVCALRGASVNVSCAYSSRADVASTLWFTAERGRQAGPEDLREDPEYAGRVDVLSPERGASTLTISGLRERDSAQYRFKFKRQQYEWRGVSPGTTLTVTAVQAQVTRVMAVGQSHTEAEVRCHSSCSPAGSLSYVWFKNGRRNLTQRTSAYADSFDPGDAVSCAFEGHEDYRSPPVYPSKLPVLSWSPPGAIVEGSSVNLTCCFHGNSSAPTTLYRGNHTLPLAPDGFYRFTSISAEDGGLYYCRTEEQLTVSLLIDVQYGPKYLSVSARPSAEVTEGSSVTLTCSSDAHPAANYSWYKEGEDSPAAAGRNFTILNFTPEHRGKYYCQAQNSRGRQSSSLRLVGFEDSDDSWMFAVALSISAVCLVLVLLFLILRFRRERAGKQEAVAGERAGSLETEEELHYASIQFAAPREEAVYSNFSPGWLQRLEEEQVIYATPKCRSAARPSCEDVSALYGKVNKAYSE